MNIDVRTFKYELSQCHNQTNKTRDKIFGIQKNQALEYDNYKQHLRSQMLKRTIHNYFEGKSALSSDDFNNIKIKASQFRKDIFFQLKRHEEKLCTKKALIAYELFEEKLEARLKKIQADSIHTHKTDKSLLHIKTEQLQQNYKKIFDKKIQGYELALKGLKFALNMLQKQMEFQHNTTFNEQIYDDIYNNIKKDALSLDHNEYIFGQLYKQGYIPHLHPEELYRYSHISKIKPFIV